MITPRPQNLIAFAGAAVALHTDVTSLPDPPTSSGDVSAWNGSEGSQSEFELRISAEGAETVSGAKLFASTDGFTTYDVVADINGGKQIDLTAAKGFRERFKHSPDITHYAITGTPGAGTVNLNVTARPVRSVR